MKQNNLEEFIASLATDEREKHQALIKECLNRKKLIREYTVKTYKSIEQLSVNVKILQNELNDLEKCCKIHTDIMDTLVTDIRPLLLLLANNKPSTN
jgi:hypothetical protein